MTSAEGEAGRHSQWVVSGAGSRGRSERGAFPGGDLLGRTAASEHRERTRYSFCHDNFFFFFFLPGGMGICRGRGIGINLLVFFFFKSLNEFRQWVDWCVMAALARLLQAPLRPLA